MRSIIVSALRARGSTASNSIKNFPHNLLAIRKQSQLFIHIDLQRKSFIQYNTKVIFGYPTPMPILRRLYWTNKNSSVTQNAALFCKECFGQYGYAMECTFQEHWKLPWVK